MEIMPKPSPQHPLESDREFSRLLQGEGSPEQFVAAVKKESRAYVKGVRDGQYSVHPRRAERLECRAQRDCKH